MWPMCHKAGSQCATADVTTSTQVRGHSIVATAQMWPLCHKAGPQQMWVATVPQGRTTADVATATRQDHSRYSHCATRQDHSRYGHCATRQDHNRCGHCHKTGPQQMWPLCHKAGPQQMWALPQGWITADVATRQDHSRCGHRAGPHQGFVLFSMLFPREGWKGVNSSSAKHILDRRAPLMYKERVMSTGHVLLETELHSH